jgi:hypothetical protein
MAVLERSNRQKQIVSRTTLGMTIGLVIFMGILITKATLLSSTTGYSVGRIGSFTLFILSKKSVGNGNYLVDIKLRLLQILLLILVCACVGFTSAILQQNINHKRDRIEL